MWSPLNSSDWQKFGRVVLVLMHAQYIFFNLLMLYDRVNIWSWKWHTISLWKTTKYPPGIVNGNHVVSSSLNPYHLLIDISPGNIHTIYCNKLPKPFALRRHNILMPHYWLNSYAKSSPPSALYMPQWSRSALVQIVACCLFDAKPLSKPMLSYC